MGGKKKKSNIMRVLSVLCGCLGAGWLFTRGWQEILDLFISYKIGNNFFSHFFTFELFSLATLITALLFFVVSIRDLGVMKDGVSVASLVIHILVAVVFIIYFVNTLSGGFAALTGFWFWYNVARFVMLIAYIAFALYCMNHNGSAFAWSVALVASVALIAISIFGFIPGSISAENLIYIILSSLAHIGVFYCGLKQY